MMENEYGNGRQSIIDELNHFIDSELGSISFERRKIPNDSKNLNLNFKRATLAGNVIALNKIKGQLKKKQLRMNKKMES